MRVCREGDGRGHVHGSLNDPLALSTLREQGRERKHG